MQTQKTTIEKLFPNHSPGERKEIEAAFDRYLDLVELVYEDIKAVPELYDQLRALTAKRQAGSMDPGRTFTSEYHDTDV
jgi:hypothetical protein